MAKFTSPRTPSAARNAALIPSLGPRGKRCGLLDLRPRVQTRIDYTASVVGQRSLPPAPSLVSAASHEPTTCRNLIWGVPSVAKRQ